MTGYESVDISPTTVICRYVSAYGLNFRYVFVNR